MERVRQDGVFGEEAAMVLTRLRQACLTLIGQLPGRTIRRPADLDRTLGIGGRPAWQIYRFSHSVDPLAHGRNVPGPAPMGRFLRAAADHNVPPRYVEAAEQAYAAFLQFVEEHAVDRRTFDSIISGYDDLGSRQVDLQHRRAAYRANSHIWGVQARTRVVCTIFNVSSEHPDTHVDAADIAGYIDLRRLRAVPITFLAAGTPVNRGGRTRFESLAPEDEVEGVPVLREFSSRPLPQVRVRAAKSGFQQFEFLPGGVGQESELSFVIGHVHRELGGPYLPDPGGPSLGNHLYVGHPAEVLIQDVLVNTDVFQPVGAEVTVRGLKGPVSLTSPDGVEDFDRLEGREQVVRLGKGIAALHTPDVPRYTEAVKYAFEHLGWDSQRFTAFRCRIEYPVLHSIVSVKLTLPQKS